MVDFRGIFFENEVTNRHRCLWVKFNIIFINVEMKISLDTPGIRVKGDNDFGVIGINLQLEGEGKGLLKVDRHRDIC